jgi:hypothetical protein
MTDAATGAVITAGASLIVAFASGCITLWNGRKAKANSIQIQNLKGAVERDLEKLRAKLAHGQIVSSTQWNAEFTSYQAIWKGMVAVRTLATKIVLRESELIDVGLPGQYLASADRVDIRKKLIEKFTEASQALLLAIHDNAPFYPAPIREAANDTHRSAKELIDKNLTAMIHLLKGVDVAVSQEFTTESKSLLQTIIEGVDRVESLIRDRLAAIEVANRAT